MKKKRKLKMLKSKKMKKVNLRLKVSHPPKKEKNLKNHS